MLLSVAVRLTNAAALAFAPSPAPSGGGGGKLDDPAPKAPKGLEGIASDWIAWAKWGALVAGVIGLIVSGIMMAIGRRNRSHLAGEGAAGIPWVVAGLSLAAMAVPIANQIMSATG
ncbi:hypothetical protein [Actinomadura violacea]|uniref:Conjugal transfer protein TrbC n=1 Tax=Actinomadura violacea TaxID=2819934 RepID=A0ABS3S7F3_9ACTN|nr:hypothetical protein [Actinomadura violacea]MBO2464937.1 hypothetical protein [Actinomadura violacea]